MTVTRPLILCINPGSTSTKIALFTGTELKQEAAISHAAEDLKDFNRIFEQKEYRASHVLKFLKENGVEPARPRRRCCRTRRHDEARNRRHLRGR
ncbi:MAG: hypothetical protein U5N86_12760 [Planctomycetota bacterium]|nr:hypothetical protein [Planctomycetota bacterium]